ncbi:MAG: hypothetical protein DRJ03_01300 [Chloroflexi bacterium]|nr:MAG: hypothetical protein DRJ03_01300 [Chloroflexota bacterium]
MIYKVPIESGNGEGYVTYDEETKTSEVVFTDQKAAKAIRRYLDTERDFWIPVSQDLEDYEVIRRKPLSDRCYWELSLCTLHAHLGIWVSWDKMTYSE